MVFSKAKMLARLEKEGRSHLVDGAMMYIMNNLDGRVATPNYFTGRDEYIVNLNGKHYVVNKLDCE